MKFVSFTDSNGCTYSQPLDVFLDGVSHDLGVDLASACGLQSENYIDEGEVWPCPSDDDLHAALRQSYPVAAVIAAICDRMGASVPAIVQDALTDCEPLPGHLPD